MRLEATIVICTHDRPEHLHRVVQTVLAQSRPADELVIVKDAPGPIDPELARQASAAGVTLTAVYTERPSLPASRNRGMDVAGGEVVLMLDDDMILPPDFLARLLALYEADPDQCVAGIGAVPVSVTISRWPDRLWNALSTALGRERWVPRRWAARSVRLPVALRDQLVPVRRLAGGTISLRRIVAKTERFDGTLSGYALGEDREFCYRVGQRHGLFLCPSLHIRHENAPLGRPEAKALGRMYVSNTFHIAARSVGGGAGTYLIMAVEMAGTFLLHAAWLPMGNRRTHWGFLVGMTTGVLEQLGKTIRRHLCGS